MEAVNMFPGISGIGVDIVRVERFKKHAENKDTRFCKRVFTKREREYLNGKGAESMAGIFAAKEAVSKALGTGFSGFFPVDIEIISDENGKPAVALHGRAGEIAGDVRLFVSISHTPQDAVAFAVALGLPG